MNKLTNKERELARQIITPHVIVTSIAPPRYKFRDGISIPGLRDRIKPDIERITSRHVVHILEKTWGLNADINTRRLRPDAVEPPQEAEQTTAQLRARVRSLEADRDAQARKLAELEARLRHLENDLYGER